MRVGGGGLSGRNRGAEPRQPHCCHGNTGRPNCAVTTPSASASLFLNPEPRSPPWTERSEDSRARGVQSPIPRRACPWQGWTPQGRGRAGLGLLSEVASPLGADRGQPLTQGASRCRREQGCSLGAGSGGAVGRRREASHQAATDGRRPCPRLVPGNPGLITRTSCLARHGPAPSSPRRGRRWQETDPFGWLEGGGLRIPATPGDASFLSCPLLLPALIFPAPHSPPTVPFPFLFPSLLSSASPSPGLTLHSPHLPSLYLNHTKPEEWVEKCGAGDSREECFSVRPFYSYHSGSSREPGGHYSGHTGHPCAPPQHRPSPLFCVDILQLPAISDSGKLDRS